MKKILLPLGLVALLLGIWEILAETGALADILGIRASVSDAIVPAPSDVAQSLWDDRDLLADNGWITLQEMLGGLAIAFVLGAGFAIVLHLSETLRRAFYPVLVASQTIPIVAIAAVLVIWLGFGIGPKLAVVALICFFPITVNMLDGLRSVDPSAVRMMRTLDGSRSAILRRLELPASLPQFFSGAKIAVAIAPIGAVLGEFVGANGGLGFLITQANANLLTARVFASIVVLSAFALVLFLVIAVAERRFAPWGGKELR
jgi:NitT/TauT family transport system permease protein/putative hydroxymethylpyrimidine transport system permease protein